MSTRPLTAPEADPPTDPAPADPPVPVDPIVAPPEAALVLQLLEPAADLLLPPGAPARVVFRAGDPRATAVLRITADRDGDPASTGDAYELGTAIADAAASTQEFTTILPPAMLPGSYSVLGTLSDGIRPSVVGVAPGRLLIDPAPAIQVAAPTTAVTVARGGFVPITFTAGDGDGSSDVRFLADADGDPATLFDQYQFAVLTTPLAAAQTLQLPLTGVPPGTWRILGVASDAGHPDAVATAPGLVTIADLAFAVAEGGGDSDEGRAIAALADGSLAATGRFAGSVSFGAWPALTVLTAAGDEDAFVGRYSADGSLHWAIRAGGPSRGDWGRAIGAFADGSVLVGGWFHGLASFDGGPLATGLLAAGEEDGFLARYRSDGSLQWAVRAGGVLRDEVSGVATCPDGSCVATGQFAAEATFGTGAAQTMLLVAGSLFTTDGFVARYHGDGSLAWVRRFGGAAGNDHGTAIAAAADGSCVVAGTFTGTATFGEGANTVALQSAGGLDVFVARYDAGGNLLWAQRGGGPDDDRASGVACRADGSCYVAGAFAGTADFGSAAPTMLAAAGVRDGFVAHFLASGTLAWVQRLGGSGDDHVAAVAVDPAGGCAVTGHFHASATFGPAPAVTTLLSAGLADLFVASYQESGALRWATRAGGPGQDSGLGLAVLADGSCAVTGGFQGDAVFGSSATARLLSATGLSDVFVARCNADGGF
ncbi:MAG: hypothetical protein WBO45_03365 [Planctomycetota bacterium]